MDILIASTSFIYKNLQMKGVVKILEGMFFSKKGKPLTSFREVLREEAKCGCGIDCCYKALVLKDQTTNVATYIYVEDGVVKTTVDHKNVLNKD